MRITHITDFTCSAVKDIDGEEHRKAYSNTAESRAEFMRECAEAEGFADVLAAWGDDPVTIPINDKAPHGLTQEERMDALEAAMLEMIMMQMEG